MKKYEHVLHKLFLPSSLSPLLYDMVPRLLKKVRNAYNSTKITLKKGDHFVMYKNTKSLCRITETNVIVLSHV